MSIPRIFFLFIVCLFFFTLQAHAETQQERVHHMSHHVMPFDMAKTLHIFKMTETGGIQQVVVRDAQDTEQVVMIRQHLRHEAEQFRQGNFSDPAQLHGAGMPGLSELQANPAAMNVTYVDIPEGGQISFLTEDIHTLTAIHRWFGAQLSEHGADARAE